MNAAQAIVTYLALSEHKMLAAELFGDLFIETNPAFNLGRFLAGCEISPEQWKNDRVWMPRLPKEEEVEE